MRSQRGISTLGSILLAAVAGLASAALLMDWLVIDVRIPDPETFSLTIPVPLVLADIAAVFIPDDVRTDIDVPEEFRNHREAVLEGLSHLLAAEDGSLVEVESPGERVTIAKRGETLLVDVAAEDATVRCAVPLAGLVRSLERWDGSTFKPELVLEALHRARSGVLVSVDAADGTRVTIRKW